jgi:predicted RNA-binding protein with PUA-like domain
MAYWLLKSEPFKWSWDMQLAAGEKGTFWDGVRNHTAKLNLMKMRLGDGVFF